jgi:hypothetical protein
VAERKMNFASSVDVVIDEKNELFNAVSVYMPSTFAAANIVDFDPAWVSAEKPAVFTCTLDNYKTIMKGKLLDQWADVYRQDTNVDVIVYVIVFLDEASTVGLWETDDVSIKYAPLTDAFEKLFFISFMKTLFDENYDGSPITLPSTAGARASARIKFSNNGWDAITIAAGTYTFSDDVDVDWEFRLENDVVVPANTNGVLGEYVVTARAASVGATIGLATGTVELTITSSTASVFPSSLDAVVLSIIPGADASNVPVVVPSKYFDTALALAYLCKNNLNLSCAVTPVRVSYVDQKPNPQDACLIRQKTSAEEKEAMTSLLTGDRAKYFWGALYLTGCVRNTWVIAHSEPVNIVPLIFAAWFKERNMSGQYVGNKLSMLRLGGTRIKPLGFPSWLNSEVNENDADGFDILDAKNVGYLYTIADNTPQESVLSSAHSIDGTPITARMISAWVDYTSRQQCAKYISDESTVTNPVLTNEDAYKKVQDIVYTNLLRFTFTNGRIANLTMKFPNFETAKTSKRKLTAASAWSANYIDDLDEVFVSGGITA